MTFLCFFGNIVSKVLSFPGGAFITADREQKTASRDTKLRPQHWHCQFNRDGLCTNKAGMFYGEIRDPDAPVCSVFRTLDNELKEEVNNGNH